jgi:hypothetical protein
MNLLKFLLKALIIGHVVLGIILIVSAALNKIGWIKRFLSSLIRSLYKIRRNLRKEALQKHHPKQYAQIGLTYIMRGLFFFRNKAKETTLIMGVGILMFSKNIASLFGYYVVVWSVQQWASVQTFWSQVWYEIWRAYPWGFPGPM